MRLDTMLDHTIPGTAEVVRGVRPDQWELATPCGDWNVRTLTNHLLQVAAALELSGAGQAVPTDLWSGDLMDGDWAGRFDGYAGRAVNAWTRPPASVSFGGTDLPGPLVLTMLAADLVIHGWDLARATGQDYRCDDDAARMAHQFVVETGDQGRQMGIFAAARPVGEDAPALDRALAGSGRDPRWSPILSGGVDRKGGRS